MATSILIVKLSSMGDVLHTLPAAQAIRAAFPHAVIGWAVERAHAELLREQPMLDDVITWQRGGGRRALGTFISKLRERRWDVAIDFQGLLRSAIVARLSGARRRIGFRPSREGAHWLYTDRVQLATLEEHAVERYLNLASHLTARPAPPALSRPYLEDRLPTEGREPTKRFPLFPSATDGRRVEAWLAEHRFESATDRLVMLFPECRKDANRWPAAKFASLARRLAPIKPLRVVLAGGPSSRRLCDQIARDAGCELWRADGQMGLLASAELLRRSAVAVTGDTGPMHLAVAVGTRVVALFGPANPLRTGPYSARATVLTERLECSPCFARRCPLHYDPPLCMEQIDVDRVVHAVAAQFQASERESQTLDQRKTA